MSDPHILLLPRLHAFGNTYITGILGPEVRKRRQIAFYKAVWALSCLATPGQPGFLLEYQDDPDISAYYHSANAMQQWANLRAAQDLLAETTRHFRACQGEITPHARRSHITLAFVCASKLQSEYGLLNWHLGRRFEVPDGSPDDIERWLADIRELPLTIYLQYLATAALSGSPPYHFDTTCSFLAPKVKIWSLETSLELVGSTLKSILFDHFDTFRTAEQVHWLDTMFGMILSFFEPPDWWLQKDRSIVRPSFAWAVITYFNARESPLAVHEVVSRIPKRGWKYLVWIISPNNRGQFYPPFDACLTAVWRVCSATSAIYAGSEILEEILHLVSASNVPSITPSVTAMARVRLLSTLTDLDQLSPSTRHSLFPETSSVATVMHLPASEEAEHIEQIRHHMLNRATLQTFTEFIECCCKGELPYKALETLQATEKIFLYFIPPEHQRRFAMATKMLCEIAVDCSACERSARYNLQLYFFQFFAADDDRLDGPIVLGEHPHLPKWLTDSEACSTWKAAFTAYLTKLSPTGDDANLFRHVQELASQLDTILHSESSQPLPVELHYIERRSQQGLNADLWWMASNPDINGIWGLRVYERTTAEFNLRSSLRFKGLRRGSGGSLRVDSPPFGKKHTINFFMNVGSRESLATPAGEDLHHALPGLSFDPQYQRHIICIACTHARAAEADGYRRRLAVERAEFR
ncbi:hypothetical protein DFH06DRAFT_1426565 [Mycena polygramma]|nr:hypothetical protein DFH06DRAFT_1426565 [Mycena polygramma]